jgi:hypothetical protein
MLSKVQVQGLVKLFETNTANTYDFRMNVEKLYHLCMVKGKTPNIACSHAQTSEETISSEMFMFTFSTF